jgi:hypothetical protein
VDGEHLYHHEPHASEYAELLALLHQHMSADEWQAFAQSHTLPQRWRTSQPLVEETEREWNPVGERLPPCSGAATLSERVEIVTQGTYHGHWRLWTAWNDSVIAWRPLPAQGEGVNDV